MPDPNFPGMRVCKDDLDQFDPWRLPAIQPENITLRHPRPDVPLDGTKRNIALIFPPNIIGVSPSSGVPGTPVIITGTNFTGVTAVEFNNVNSSFTIDSDIQITALVPSGTGTVDIRVVNLVGTSTKSNAFTYAPPNIIGVSPSNGTPGTSVTITGTNFTGVTVVEFNNVNSSFTIDSDIQITVSAPSGTGTVDITVIGPTGTSIKSNAFTYDAPVQTFVAGVDYPVAIMLPFGDALNLPASISVDLVFAIFFNSAAGKSIRMIGNGGATIFDTTVTSSASTAGEGIIYLSSINPYGAFAVESFTLT
jgi:hypothetical protein